MNLSRDRPYFQDRTRWGDDFVAVMAIGALQEGLLRSSHRARHVFRWVHRLAEPVALIAFRIIHAIVSSCFQSGESAYGRHETGLRWMKGQGRDRRIASLW